MQHGFHASSAPMGNKEYQRQQLNKAYLVATSLTPEALVHFQDLNKKNRIGAISITILANPYFIDEKSVQPQMLGLLSQQGTFDLSPFLHKHKHTHTNTHTHIGSNLTFDSANILMRNAIRLHNVGLKIKQHGQAFDRRLSSVLANAKAEDIKSKAEALKKGLETDIKSLLQQVNTNAQGVSYLLTLSLHHMMHDIFLFIMQAVASQLVNELIQFSNSPKTPLAANNLLKTTLKELAELVNALPCLKCLLNHDTAIQSLGYIVFINYDYCYDYYYYYNFYSHISIY